MALRDQLDLNQLLSGLERLPGPQKAMVLAGIVAVMVGLYWFMFYGGKSSELASLQGKLSKLERDLVESRAVASNLSTFTGELDRLSQELDEAVRQLPSSTELPILLTDITSVGKKSGLEFRSFRPRSEVNKGFYAQVPIDIEVRGSYHNLGLFFDRVAHLARIVRISEFDIDMENENKDPPTLKIRGVAETFRFVEKAGSNKSGGR
jgi:type IV pilus assembly protein PilO